MVLFLLEKQRKMSGNMQNFKKELETENIINNLEPQDYSLFVKKIKSIVTSLVCTDIWMLALLLLLLLLFYIK